MTATPAPGLKHQILLTVEKHHTADAYGNPGVEVFATPALITLFENVCGECIRPFLSEDGFSVGTRVDIRHLGATPLGFEVSEQCEVIEVDRRRVVFRVEAHDGVEKIGEGTHERFIMDNLDLFLQKTRDKFQQG